MATRAIAVLGLLSGLVLAVHDSSVLSYDTETVSQQWVFVTEDRAINVPGCDAVTVFELSGREHLDSRVIFRSAFRISPGRLAGSADFRVVTALSSNSGHDPPFLRILKQKTLVPPYWEESIVASERLISLAGHAVLADDDTVLLPMRGHSVELDEQEQYFLEKYRISEMSNGRLGPPRGILSIDSPPIRVFVANEGHTIHTATISGTVISADVFTMKDNAPRIYNAPITVKSPVDSIGRLARSHATLSFDERYLVTNTWENGGIGIADLITRDAHILVLRPGRIVGGVEFSRSGYSRGLLAANTIDRVAVYSLDNGTKVREVASREISPITHDLCFDRQTEFCSGPYAAISWGGDGSYLVAAGHNAESEFEVLNVLDRTYKLAPATWLTACDDPSFVDFPNDILTSNRTTAPSVLPTPTTIISLPTSTKTPRVLQPTPSATSTGTATLTATRVPSVSSPTPVTSSTPMLLRAAFLPLALEMSCLYSTKHDVVFVMDLSSSMMLVDDLNGQRRLDTAVAGVGDALLRHSRLSVAMPELRTAIVGFNESAWTVYPLSLDVDKIRDVFEHLEQYIKNGSRLDLGILEASEILQRNSAGRIRTIVLVSDGEIVDATTLDRASEVIHLIEEDGTEVHILQITPSGSEHPAPLASLSALPDRYHRVNNTTMTSDATVGIFNERRCQR